MNCKYCNKEVKKGNKFCNSSHAAKFNNANRTFKPGQDKRTKYITCKRCNKKFEVNIRSKSIRYCDECQYLIRIECRRSKGIKERKPLTEKDIFNNDIGGMVLSNSCIKRALIRLNKLKYKCDECDIIDTWNNKNITLELDHINGDNKDNRLENLRFLCHNCHSQTDTFRGRNINSGKIKVSEEKLIEAIRSTDNIRQALLKVGLSATGSNYDRVNKIILKL